MRHESESKREIIGGPEYNILVHAIYEKIRNSTKDGLRKLEGRFYPRNSGESFSISFNPSEELAILNVGDFGGFIESSTTYSIKDGMPAMKTGFAEGHRNPYILTYYENSSHIDMDFLEEGDFISDPLTVELWELEVISKIVDNPRANPDLVKSLQLLNP